MKNKLGNNKLFDSKMGLVGALFLGTIVFLINLNKGWEWATIAASKQAFYTFLAGGLMMRLVENLSTKWDNKFTAYIISVGTASVIAIALTFLMHSLKGTHKPLLSTIPTMVLGPLGFFWWAYKKRKKLH